MKSMLKPLLMGIMVTVTGSAAADKITFYQDDNYRGRQFTAEGEVPNFARNGFNDRVNSAVVHEGRWEICIDSEFRGGCSILGPGAYPTLGAYAGRISSVRPVDGRYSRERSDDRGHNREARAMLYEGPNLSGRSFLLTDWVPNLAPNRVQRPGLVAARRERLLDLLQRLRVPGRMPHVRSRRLRRAARSQQRDLVGPPDLELLSLRRPAGLAARRAKPDAGYVQPPLVPRKDSPETARRPRSGRVGDDRIDLRDLP